MIGKGIIVYKAAGFLCFKSLNSLNTVRHFQCFGLPVIERL